MIFIFLVTDKVVLCSDKDTKIQKDFRKAGKIKEV